MDKKTCEDDSLYRAIRLCQKLARCEAEIDDEKGIVETVEQLQDFAQMLPGFLKTASGHRYICQSDESPEHSGSISQTAFNFQRFLRIMSCLNQRPLLNSNLTQALKVVADGSQMVQLLSA